MKNDHITLKETQYSRLPSLYWICGAILDIAMKTLHRSMPSLSVQCRALADSADSVKVVCLLVCCRLLNSFVLRVNMGH